ncbi:hypothetical protein DRN97_09835 [Methanosarcinales archaeon]|nr:MAG: hypothetical protein DRN97_09835 [Methanosarcinales archaeon]
MGKIVEQIIVELFSDELNRETMVCPNCGRMVSSPNLMAFSMIQYNCIFELPFNLKRMRRMLNRRDMHERTVETMIGEIKLRRPYFYCTNCKKGFHPLDDALILSDTVKQWDMQEAGAIVGAELPYNKAQEMPYSLEAVRSVVVRGKGKPCGALPALRCAKYNGTFQRLFLQYMHRVLQKKDT